MKMDKSNKIIFFAITALVFVTFYVASGLFYGTGTERAIEDTIQSIVLVGVATVLTWAVIREQQKRGRLKS